MFVFQILECYPVQYRKKRPIVLGALEKVCEDIGPNTITLNGDIRHVFFFHLKYIILDWLHIVSIGFTLVNDYELLPINVVL